MKQDKNFRIAARVLACFLISGATGLVYEVLWLRMLGLIFGHTVFAITTVLAAFMAGLGLGSYLFGKIADRARSPLFLYGLLEGGIGLYCLIIPLLIALAERLYVSIYQLFHLSYYAFSLTQFFFVFGLLALPTTLMGATLPLLSRFFVAEEKMLCRRVGSLYALNTLGAVLGAGGAGYFFLPVFGMQGTLYLTAIVNLGIAALVLYWSRSFSRELLRGSMFNVEPRTLNVEAIRGENRPLLVSLVIFGLGLSGAASMIYEVAWSRALALVIGSSTYAFTAMLVSFLVGIALGSALFAKFFGAKPLHPFVFGALQTAIGLFALAMLPVLGMMPEIFLKFFRISTSAGFIQTAQFLISFAAMLLPTLLIGATFPCVVGIATRGLDRVGSDVGRIYTVNTLGAVLGSFAAGFLLIPSIGAHATVKLGIILNLGLGAMFVLASIRAQPTRTWLPWAALSAAAFGALYWTPPWNPVVMSSGVAIYGPSLSRAAGKANLAQALLQTKLLFYEDGISSTVTVHRNREHTFLRVNGKTDASSGADMKTQLMLGHLPLLLHPHAKSVAIIGLGSGVTAAAVARYPVERIHIIEIEPAVVRASRFFEKENRKVLNDPRVRVIITDGRNFLLSASERYDVIISEPSNPWIGGVATLFSREFFGLARQRLRPGGLMAQWVHGYGLFPGDLKMVVKTFRTAFPATTIWNTTFSDYLLLGREQPAPVDLERLSSLYDSRPGIKDDLRGVGLRSGPAVLSDFLLAAEDAERYASDAAVNTDDRLALEFSAPLSLYADTSRLNYRVMKGYQTREFPVLARNGSSRLERPEIWFELGMSYKAKGIIADAVRAFEKALKIGPDYLPARLELGKSQLLLNLPLKAAANFEAILKHSPRHAEATFQLGITYQSQQMVDRALDYLAKAVALSPENPAYQTRLATLLREQGRPNEAVAHYRAALALKPKEPSIVGELGQTYLQLGLTGQAIDAFKQALALDSASPDLYRHLGRAYFLAKRFGEAVEALTLAARYAPLFVEAWVDLFKAYSAKGEVEKAAESLRRVTEIDPFHPEIQRLRAAFAADKSPKPSKPVSLTSTKGMP